MNDPKFIDWCNELRREMEELANRVAHGVGPTVDSMIPYRLDWSPKRTAFALLGINLKDGKHLSRLMMGDKHTHAGAIQETKADNSCSDIHLDREVYHRTVEG